MPPVVAHLLLVDRDDATTGLLRDYLGRFGFSSCTAADRPSVLQRLDERPVDLIVLDLSLPGIDGLALMRALRAGSCVPVILLSGRDSAADRVIGLEMGADDCMVKPFDPRELVARIKTVLRRADGRRTAPPTPASADTVQFDGWRLERSERRLTSPNGLVVALSNAEYRLLSTFLKAPRRVVSRDQLMAQARGRTLAGCDRSIDLLVSRLRQKLLGDADGDRGGGGGKTSTALIRTVRGAGYLFDARSVQGLAAA